MPLEAEAMKAEGNAAFQAKSFADAARLYQEAIDLAKKAKAAVPGVYFSCLRGRIILLLSVSVIITAKMIIKVISNYSKLYYKNIILSNY